MESEIVLDESGYRKKNEATVQHSTEQRNFLLRFWACAT